LIFHHNINPIAFNFFGYDIYWYGVSYVFGIYFGEVYAKYLLRNDVSREVISNYIIYIVLGILLGGKLGYAVIYHRGDLLSVFTTRDGMSFHGGVVGVVMFTYLYTKKYHINFLKMTDIVCTVAPIGIFFGRIANFINGELYGREALKFGVIFHDGMVRHPSQLYEALLEGLLLFVIMNQSFKGCFQTRGKLTGIFLLFYGLFRILCEFFREPDSQIGYILNFTMGQILSVPLIIVSIYLLKRSVK
jgi:phosphatidylglycerol:prolipoprotein diacylglycerol transferase